MSTQLLEDTAQGVFLTRFFGGTKRGVCYQITVTDHDGYTEHISITKAQMHKLTNAYFDSILGGK